MQDPTKYNYVLPLQAMGLGDILFSQTLVRNLADGRGIIWPVLTQFQDGLKRAYPDISFRPKQSVLIDFDNKEDRIESGVRILPIRWASEILKVPYKDCMRAKYDLYNQDFTTWKDKAMFQRDLERENELKELVGAKGDYTLINRFYRSDSSGCVQIKEKGIEMCSIPGYSMFDWAGVIEGAKQIHTVSTSILFMLELLELQCAPHIYLRRPEEFNHDNYSYLLTKNYIYE